MSHFSLQYVVSSTRSSCKLRFNRLVCLLVGLVGAVGRTWPSLMVNVVVTRVDPNNINSTINSEPTIVTMVVRVAGAKSTSHNGPDNKRLIKCPCLEVNAPQSSLPLYKRWTRPIFRPSDKVRSSQEGVAEDQLEEL